MISLYSGTPGSGKSLSMCKEVCYWLKSLQKNVIANTFIKRDKIIKKGKKGGHMYYFNNETLTTDLLYKYALKFHKLGKESQTLLVIDEAQIKFSPVACKLFSQENRYYRQDWLEFFTQHRHLGFDVIIVTQFDRLIDSQIRCLFEYNFVHRKANNFQTIGKLLTIFRIPLFIQIQYWYGIKEISGQKFFTYRKKYSEIYDSFSFRNQIIAKLTKKYGEEQMLYLMGFKRKTKKTLKKVEVVPHQEQQEKKFDKIEK